jgi:hypothetical protein
MDDEKTLRDEFAIAAMAGDWASQLGHFDEDVDSDHLRERAALYYRMADAMLVARKPRVVPFRRRDDPQPPDPQK